ncbi:MAG: acyltransferase [Actinomycetota bacterium]|nr:acyltransferase [Actinomycetota bacterium]
MSAPVPADPGPGGGRSEPDRGPTGYRGGIRAGDGHLGAVDLVRFVTITGVVAVHCTSLTADRSSLAAGGVLSVLHVTRSVFLFLSAFVLTYSYQRRPRSPKAFWKHRYPLIICPYVTWSAIYVLTDGELHRGVGYVVGHYLLDLLDGGAHFQLYYMLLPLQLYLIYPSLVGWLQRHRRTHRPLLLASVAFQLSFTAAIHYGWRPPVLGIWLTHSGSWLPSYELYIAGGLVAALHFEEVTAWVRSHGRLLLVAVLSSIALAEVSYVCDLRYLGYSPIRASQVFQPTVVIEAVTITLAQYYLGLWVTDRAGVRGRQFLERTADASFGVFLAHPLLVGAILDLASISGLAALVGRLPGGVIEALAVLGLVPFVYAVTYRFVVWARHTRVSVWLTGRATPFPPGARELADAPPAPPGR